MGMTIAEKIIAAAAGVDSVKPGGSFMGKMQEKPHIRTA